MNDNIEELRSFQKTINRLKEKKANLEGRLDSAKEILKKDFGINSIKEAEAKLVELEKAGNKAKNAFSSLKQLLKKLLQFDGTYWEEDD